MNALGSTLNDAIMALTDRGIKMSDWRIRHREADGRDAESVHICREAAIVEALYLERRQYCRI